MSVLIVEDDAAIRESLKELLEGEGYAVDTAENGEIALQTLRRMSEVPSLILLDLAMPVMDGYQFRCVQSQDPALSRIPTLVMTAAGAVEDHLADSNVVAVLKKPLDLDPFLDLIKATLSWEKGKTSCA